MAFEHLLSEGRIGPLVLRNRFVLTPMGDDLGNEDGTVSDAQVAYLEERARGGVAVVMLGSVGVAHPVGCSNPRQTAISEARFIPGWRRAAERVHAQGGKLAMQLTHAGKNGIQDVLHGRPLWIPSPPGTPNLDPLYQLVTPEEGARQGEPYTSPTSKTHYRVMDEADIAQVVDEFATAAERAAEAGVDAVEIHAGHGYLVDAFLSKTINKRTDGYGGTLERRSRFLLEILRETRRRVGGALAVWVRLNSAEEHIDGTRLEDAVQTAQWAEEAGADAVHVTAYHDPAVATGPTDSYIPHTPGLLVPRAKAVREKLGIPVIAVGRISPEEADEQIGAGAFDFVAMGRQLLADPDLPNKLARGERGAVRPCVHQYRCIGNIYLRKSVRCVANVRTGREDRAEVAFPPAEIARRVLVVGAGPAGLEAARVAAMRGHQVELVEAGDRLGGRWALAAGTAMPKAELLAWYDGELKRLGVAPQLGTRLDAAAAAAREPDVVVVATGARWSRSDFPGAAADHVRTVDELAPWLRGESPLGVERLVILGGDVPGMAVAEKAHAEGVDVTLLSFTTVFGDALGLPGRWRRVKDLQQAGVTLATRVRGVSIGFDAVAWETPDGPRTSPADQVVVTSEIRPDTGLADELDQLGVATHAIGDCVAPGLLEGAVHSAALVAGAL
jgi:2,4-dienoyl-CoA reductase (NADPH2)